MHLYDYFFFLDLTPRMLDWNWSLIKWEQRCKSDRSWKRLKLVFIWDSNDRWNRVWVCKLLPRPLSSDVTDCKRGSPFKVWQLTENYFGHHLTRRDSELIFKDAIIKNKIVVKVFTSFAGIRQFYEASNFFYPKELLLINFICIRFECERVINCNKL